jgi:hypothetical protein
MYLALWIDDRKDTAQKRIVFCQPLLKRENAAVALLNSQKRDDADSMILSGDDASLNRFAAMVDAADDDWTTTDFERIADAIGIVAEKAGCSVVPFGDRAAQVAAQLVLGAIKRIPKPGLYPRYITKEGKEIWDEVVVQYKKTIDKYRASKEKMWAAAILIYKRVAEKRNVNPFGRDFGKAHRGKMLTELHRRINRGNHKALKAVEQAAGMLAKQQLGTRLTNEKFYEAAQHNKRYYMTTYQVQNVKDAAKAIDFLIEKNWGAGVAGKYVHHAIQLGTDAAQTDVLAEPVRKNRLYYYITTPLTRDMLSILWPTLEDADSQTIMRKLGIMGRKWVKTGTMRALAAATRFLQIHVSDRKAPGIVRVALGRLDLDYLFRTRRELVEIGYPRNVTPRFDLEETSVPVAEIEQAIMREAVRRGLTSLGFEVVD